ncbi:putative procollagen-lysine [Powai lake megavirus]|uniref:Putative procollagen-lysine n=1 Tax=Powai lake megavirus TaxID=1842663 RepID=A0A167R6Q6_9VIRU|nr:putative procollagen-lysine [Powai lake megavirus]ANB50371.1 putative procollagen-lysine [Powai lake megavirus]
MEDILILGIGVSLKKNDGVLRFEKYCQIFDLPYLIVGDGKIWKGGDMSVGAGGGQKINELLIALKTIIDNKLIIVCDTFDLFPVANKQEILNKYYQICGEKERVVFSSEVYCWPEKNLANTYTEIYPNIISKYRYLNSGSFMGRRNDIYAMLNNILDTDDDQLFFTKKYLQTSSIILDVECQLFQAINGSTDDIGIHDYRVYNKYTKTFPIFIHGNGPAKTFLNYLENNLHPKSLINIINAKPIIGQYKVFIALYIDSNSINELKIFLDNVTKINYNNKIVYVYDKSHSDYFKQLLEMLGFIYSSNVSNYVFVDFVKTNCDYYFLLEQNCILTNPLTLETLIYLCRNNNRIISPLLIGKENTNFSNFWGALDKNGYYKRSDDYLNIIRQEKIGLWNVPYVYGVILFDKSIINDWNLSQYEKHQDDRDMNLCFNLRKYTLFMYTCNLDCYGYII